LKPLRSHSRNLSVLFEDNHLIAVNKRSGDLVQGDRTGDLPLSDVVKEWLKAKYDKPGKVFLGVVHRIDRPVSGVVVFAKTGKALSRMNELFKSKEVDKTYLAAVCSPPPQNEGRLTDFLRRFPAKNMSRAVKAGAKDAKRATLDYRLLGKSDNYFFLEVHPHTGRHHQIRVQLANMGCPIKGDVKYGANRTNKDASIHLHARAISFMHPVRKTRLTVEAPLPDDPVWDILDDIIS